ncbi:MAG: deoxyribodipyrimidine photo-lyase [Opitutales bacterium]
MFALVTGALHLASMSETSSKIPQERIHRISRKYEAGKGRYVLYWMQQSGRVEHNHALEYAVQRANELELPVVVGFGLMHDYPEANARSYTFLLQGLADVEAALAERKIGFVLKLGHPAEVALELASDAALVVVDGGYLKHQRAWREKVGNEADHPVYVVETDLVVPLKEASDKQEHAARTIRPKIHRQFDRFMVGLNATKPKHDSTKLKLKSDAALDDVPGLVEHLGVDTSVPPVAQLFSGGEQAAQKTFRNFLRQNFRDYAKHRNRPETTDVSHMSMYLHFGHVSPIWLVREVRKHTKASGENYESFVEELVVRRELAHNFCFHNRDYDNLGCLPDWAKQTLKEHEDDARPNVFTRQQLEDAQTDDPYWNAAMREMRHTGYMHNYMRMYWGKQFIAYTNTAGHAHKTALAINNKYFLDGRDANSFANVLWLFGIHDRGWTERPIFGKVRIMKQSGLKRKCDIDAYMEKVDRLCEKAGA